LLILHDALPELLFLFHFVTCIDHIISYTTASTHGQSFLFHCSWIFPRLFGPFGGPFDKKVRQAVEATQGGTGALAFRQEVYFSNKQHIIVHREREKRAPLL
jgi:hypothetical protein